MNHKLATVLLQKLGYQADVANNGIEAIRLMRKNRYALILMDCQMPEMDGFEATARIRNADSKVLNAKIPIVAMTANAMKGDREKYINAGMDDYLPKPVKPEQLAATLNKWVH